MGGTPQRFHYGDVVQKLPPLGSEWLVITRTLSPDTVHIPDHTKGNTFSYHLPSPLCWRIHHDDRNDNRLTRVDICLGRYPRYPSIVRPPVTSGVEL